MSEAAESVLELPTVLDPHKALDPHNALKAVVPLLLPHRALLLLTTLEPRRRYSIRSIDAPIFDPRAFRLNDEQAAIIATA